MLVLRRTTLSLLPCLILQAAPPVFAQKAAAKAATTSTTANVEQAEAAVHKAEELYNAGNWAQALTQFEAARDLLAGHPAQARVINNIALCQEKLLRIDAAIQSYEAYRDTLPKADAERAELDAKIAALRANSGQVTFSLELGAVATRPVLHVLIDNQPQPEADSYTLPAGDHIFTIHPEGYDEQSKPVNVVAGKTQALSFGLVDPYKEAKERVNRAEKLYEAGNYDAALTEFQRAYETMLGHPARPYVLYNIARCQERLYRYDAAIASYKEYLNIAGPGESDRPKVEATIESLEGFLGTISLAVSAKKDAAIQSYEVWVDGHLVGENIKQFLIPGGTHQVEIRAEGFEGASQEVQVPARDQRSVTFTLAPLAKEYHGISRTYFYTAAGLTVAAAATGTAFGLVTVSKRRDIDQKEPEAVTDDDVDGLKRSALYADIFFISAGVLATSATILAFLTDWSDKEGPPATASVAKKPGKLDVNQLGISPIHQGGYLSVGGTFSW